MKLVDFAPKKRNKIVHDIALRLFKLRYDWGYYPEATRDLDVTDMSLDEALNAKRKELEDKYTDKKRDREPKLNRINKKIRRGGAVKGEIEYYELWRNKITGNWMNGVAGEIETLRPLGGEYCEIHDEIVDLGQRITDYREEMARRARKTRTTEGFIPFGDRSFSDAMRTDVSRADALIDRIFILILTLLYPQDMARREGKKSKITREEINQLLSTKIIKSE